MSFAAEPYGVFVDDLLSGLTGGVVREEFVFTEEHEPFRLAAGVGTLAGTVRVHGLANGAFRRFADGVDYTVDAGTISWLTSEPGVPAAGATWPDRGT